MIEIFVDGSCRNNGKENSAGGYAVVVTEPRNDSWNLLDVYVHQEENTTNNIQELKAIIYAMLHYGKAKELVTVYSDSAYSVNVFNDWMFKWVEKGWIKSDNKTPENLELIQLYYDLYQQGYRINLQKVKGHANNERNELADKLATGKLYLAFDKKED